MGALLTAFNAVLPLFLVIFAGIVFSRTKTAGEIWVSVLNNYALKVGLPALVIASLILVIASLILVITSQIQVIISHIYAIISHDKDKTALFGCILLPLNCISDYQPVIPGYSFL